MNIYGISIVKNEADIIEYSLTNACTWVTKVFVMDNGSEDETWEKVKKMAKTSSKIIPFRQSNEPFHDGLRAKVFNEFKHLAKEDDWWCVRLDADEFYIEDPTKFLKSRVKPYHHVVCSKHIQYQLVESDLNSFTRGLNIEERLNRIRCINKQATSEVRFFRHRKRLTWNESQNLPKHVGLVCPERILLRHYQFRSLEQIQRRIETRLETRRNFPYIFPHVVSTKPTDYLAKPSDCIEDTGQIWLYNMLPLSNNKTIAYRWWVFWIRRILHSTGIFP
jgi:glycosyltransferase involved in cell wall biosynthesis